MRDDMFKVIVERPRWGSRMKTYRGTKGGNFEDMPKNQGMRRHTYRKELNENLAPLKRYLERNCNRPWNKVFSEISAKIDGRSTVKAHVRDHIEDLVALHIGIGADSKLFDRQRPNINWRGKRWHQRFYVAPKSGILRDSRLYWRKQGIYKR